MVHIDKFVGSAPDAAKRSPGAHCEVVAMNPHMLGARIGPVVAAFGSGAVPSSEKAFGAARLMDSGYNVKRYIGTATKLYSFTTSAGYTDLTRAVGGAYNGSDTNSWAFAEFGAISLAINKGDQLQQRTLNSATAFANVAGAPKADVMIVCGPPASPFVMLLNYDDGTDVPDGWYCSAISDYTGWTAGTSESAKGQIVDNPGPLISGIAYRDGVVAFKEDGMWIGEYVGSPVIWAWRRIASDIGCIGKNAVVNINDVIYFAGRDGLYTYDGSYPRRIPGQVHDWWTALFNTLATTYATAVTTGPVKNRHSHQVCYYPREHLIAFMMGNDPGTAGAKVPRFVPTLLWLNIRTGVWLIDSRFSSEGFYRFVDEYCYIDSGTATSYTTQTAQSFNFAAATGQAASYVGNYVQAQAEPKDSHVRSMKPLYETITAAHVGMVAACRANTWSADFSTTSGMAGTVNATVGTNDGWADITDQAYSGNIVAGTITWSAIPQPQVVISGLVLDIVPSGEAHG